jgi:hypothetical protein
MLSPFVAGDGRELRPLLLQFEKDFRPGGTEKGGSKFCLRRSHSGDKLALKS